MTKAFTLIELLVVVTIIAVLLALLTPALDRAIYQAELVRCAGKLKATGAGIAQYAFENKRFYPYRQLDQQAPNSTGNTLMINPMALSRPQRFYDMRPQLSTVLDINTYLQCPFTRELDLVSHDVTDSDVNVEASYAMFWGWRYLTADQTKIQAKQQQKVRNISANTGERGMNRMGDRFSWLGDSFNLLAADIDMVYPDSSQASHPDRDPDRMFLVSAQSEVILGLRGTVSRWLYRGGVSEDPVQQQIDDVNETPTGNSRARGLLDLNYLYDNGGVVRHNGVLGYNKRDKRMEWIPLQFDAQRAGDDIQIPKN